MDLCPTRDPPSSPVTLSDDAPLIATLDGSRHIVALAAGASPLVAQPALTPRFYPTTLRTCLRLVTNGAWMVGAP